MLKKQCTSVIASLLLAVSAQTTPAAAQSGTIVAIDAGTIGGRVAGDVLSFKGIPYAAPPVGARRWRSPQPVKPWAGVRRAIEYGHDCMQKVEPGEAAPPGTVPAEDCLVLNVWRPAAGAPDDKQPVLVWIHGGAYVNGGASTPIYDGSAIVTSMPGDILRRGEAMRMPVMIGSTSADLPVVLPPSRQNPLSFFGPEADTARALDDPAGKLNALELLLAVGVDMTMHEPARFVAQQVTQAGQPAWLYRFDYVAQSLRPKQAGAAHASELPFLFGTLDARYGRNATDKDRAAAQGFNAYFANFARQGDPNGQGLPDWTKFDPARAELMHFTPDKGPVMGPDPWKERLDLVARTQEAQAAPPDAARDLAGSWQLVRFQGGDDKVLVPDDKAKYTLAIEEGGGVSVRIDCNRGRGTWRSAGPNQLLFGPLALTRAMCPPAPLTDRLAKDWAFVRSYVIRDSRLFLSLMADAGIYEFERQ